jgi:Mlc titration factor MtfA (ptsG expression regulator)
MFPWVDNARRKRILDAPWPRAWEKILSENSGHAALLKGELRSKWQQTIQVLVGEKNWEGCGGLAMTDEVKVTVGASAALMLLGMQHDYFAKVRSIVVFPSDFELPMEEWQKEAQVAAGLAPPEAVFLSWDWGLDSSKNISNGYNIVIHEFAHHLDFLDGYTNGCPDLRDKEQARRWQAAMSAGFEQVQQDLEKEGKTFLGEYAASNATEFFAELSECFFTIPGQLKELYPAIYDVLMEYYGLDTTKWFQP